MGRFSKSENYEWRVLGSKKERKREAYVSKARGS